MIPDFKTFLKESIWSDMQERGTGDAVKKEDEVNILDLDRLCKYLNQIYGEFDHRESIKVNEWRESRWLSVDIADTPSGYNLIITYDICPETEEKIISMAYEIVKNWIDFNKLEKRYNSKVEKNEYDNDILTIYPKDGSEVTNEFLIDFIDYMLEEIPSGYDKYIYRKNNESIWSDMQDRGTGDMEKIEDNIDRIYDLKKLYEYIQKRYDPEKRFSSVSKSELTLSIGIDYFSEYGAKDLSVNLYWWKNEKVLNISCTKPVLEELSKKYDIAEGGRQLKQRGDDLKNSTIIGVIDTILEVIPKHKQMEAFIK